MIRNFLQLGLLLCLSAGALVAQTEPPVPPAKPAPKAKVEVVDKTKQPGIPRFARDERYTSERAIPADPNVAVKLCVSEGAVKINGWERNEVRVFVRNGRKFEFRSLEKNPETGKANWIWITNQATGVPMNGPMSNCLAGDTVEIDLPMAASVGLEARTSGAVIDSVRKANVKVIEGSIALRNIPGGVSAEAFQGDVMIESSAGQISLQTTTGNILAFDVKPGSVGDLLKAKTNSGAISLQSVNHRQIEANSISGTVSFNGKFLPGGLYNFKTSNGSVRMLLPQDTSCKMQASYGFGNFDSAIPFTLVTENLIPGGKSIVAKFGNGDANVTVTTSSGSIGIRKQN